MNKCESCIQYKLFNKTTALQECPKCHTETLDTIQNEFGLFELRCGNCGIHISADLNTPCELIDQTRDDLYLIFPFYKNCKYPYSFNRREP